MKKHSISLQSSKYIDTNANITVQITGKIYIKTTLSGGFMKVANAS